MTRFVLLALAALFALAIFAGCSDDTLPASPFAQTTISAQA